MGGIILKTSWPHAWVVAVRDVAGRVHDLHMHRNGPKLAPLRAVIYECFNGTAEGLVDSWG